MKPLRVLSMFLLPALLLIYTGCKKDEGEKPFVETHGCMIDSFSFFGTQGVTIAYNANKTIASLTAENIRLTYIYAGNTVIISSDSTDNWDSVTLNNAGYLINMRSYHADGITWDNKAFVYNNNNELVSTTTTYSAPGSAPYVITYTYQDGNIVTSTSAGTTRNYAYDLTKPALMGNGFHLSELMIHRGFKVFKTKNLVISEGNYFYGYDFDAAGKITRVTMTDGPTVLQMPYRYTCP